MDLTQLSIRILYDIIPDSLLDNNTAIYCFAHNDINIPFIATTIQPFSNRFPIYILKNIGYMSGVSDYKDVIALYNSFDISTKVIEYNDNWINTKIESNAVISWCASNNIKNLIISAPIFHIIRAYMTIVSSLSDHNINIYAIPVKINQWSNITITHQGKNRNSFNNFIKIELERIEKYILKGDILQPNIIWDYMLKRPE